jgi:hypothetical protein
VKCVTITDAELAELRARLSAAEQERDHEAANATRFFKDKLAIESRAIAAEARAEAAEQALREIADGTWQYVYGGVASFARAALAGREPQPKED